MPPIRRLTALARTIAEGVYDWDLTTRLAVYSPHWKEMHGFSQQDEQESPEHWSKRIHPDDRARVLDHLDEYLVRKRQEFREEYRIRRCDGSWMWVLECGIALWNAAGQAVRLVGSEKDITQRKQEEDLLRQHDARLEDLTAKLLAAQERERERLARELHDDFTQRLAVLAVDIGSLEQSLLNGIDAAHQIKTRYPNVKGLFGNRSVLIVIAVCALLQIAYVHTGPMQVVFHSTHLTFEEWFKVVLVGVFVFAFAEVEKAVIRCFGKSAVYRTSIGQSDRSICKRGT